MSAFSSATTNGADVVGGRTIDGLTDFSATIDGLSAYTFDSPIISAALSPVVGASIATTNGADVTAASATSSIAASSATTNGADVTAASVSVSVAVLSATTNGADVSASSVGVSVAASSSTTNGVDVTAASVGVVVSATSTTSDGADLTEASASATISVSSATTDGVDITASAVDTGEPAINTPSQEVAFRKYYMRKGKKILMFDSVDEAEAYTQAEALADEAIAKANKTSRLARKRLRNHIVSGTLPAQTIDTDWLAEMLQRFAMAVDLPALLAQRDYARVMEIYALAMAMQDEEDDIELLLMMG